MPGCHHQKATSPTFMRFLFAAPNDSPRHECLATPERKNCKLWHAYSIHILKTPLFGPSDDYLWHLLPVSLCCACLLPRNIAGIFFPFLCVCCAVRASCQGTAVCIPVTGQWKTLDAMLGTTHPYKLRCSTFLSTQASKPLTAPV